MSPKQKNTFGKPPGRFPFLLGGTAFLFLFGIACQDGAYAQPEDCDPDKIIRIEMNLAKQWKKDKKDIQAAFKEKDGNFKARVDFQPFLDPPMNIGIGRCVSAEQARFALQQAIRYNRGINRLIYQKALPDYWVGIGYLKLPERTWVSLNPEGLASLQDPALSTESFQNLYQELSQIQEQPGIFGMPPIPVQPE